MLVPDIVVSLLCWLDLLSHRDSDAASGAEGQNAIGYPVVHVKSLLTRLETSFQLPMLCQVIAILVCIRAIIRKVIQSSDGP